MKTRFIHILFVAGILFILPCCKTVTYTAQVTPLEDNVDGEIFLRANGNGSSEKEALLASEKNAFNSLLFRGITGTQQARPLIENENEARSQHADFFTAFFDKRGYQQFIISSDKTGSLDKSGSNRVTTSDIKINLRGLREYLVQNGIIRKFGW